MAGLDFEKEVFGTFRVTAARIIDAETFAFVLHADDADKVWQEAMKRNEALPVRFVSGNTSTKRWGSFEFLHILNYKIGAGRNERGNKQALFGSNSLHFFSMEYGDGPNDMDSNIDLQTSLDAIEFIDGHFYASGGKKFLARRDADGTWDVLSYVQDRKAGAPNFELMKGFAADDIYLVDMTIWHWNGRNFTEIALPKDVVTERQATTFLPLSIAIDDAKRVYIGSTRGAVIYGNAQAGFQVLQPEDEELKLELRQMAWFDGALWAVNKTGLYKLGPDGWTREDFLEDEDRPFSFHFIDARDGKMLVAGPFSGSVYDGTKWTHLYGEKNPDAVFHQKMLQQQLDDMKELRESARKLRGLKDP